MAIPKLQAYALPEASDIPANKVNWAFEPSRAALLIHDMQEYFLNFWGENSAMMEKVVANIAALRRMGYDTKTEMTGHGFRAMARTILHEELGIDRDVIEHQLAHAVPDALGTAYNRTKFIKDRRMWRRALKVPGV